ncbi:chorismate pyruvate-lyase family protein [Ruminiclostridium cellulolyticum]|uniref:Chorismate lyase n=1 Tax=Ruminiclostridium cellulolyticum (strain ATCC 35319 / DSM 5812 / JCM 6584 / H10) TaxID=394503 RepID=B8I0Z3_RUMCH|nr:chorismate pyruvate-lyase family protein [Ruminiclostridium cellulolyticum]ACL77549.1 protein of unknown function DUF98 [Ruminiclostridium cellulolyticum H10]
MMQMNNSTNRMLLTEITQTERKLADILLVSKSSTTRLLEIMTGREVEINVTSQKVTEEKDLSENYYDYISPLKKSEKYLKRTVSLHSHGNIFSDNIVIASFDNISDEIKNALLRSKTPLGKIIKDNETKREILWSGYLNKNELNAIFGEQRFSLLEYPFKKYLIYVNDNCCFCLLEVFNIKEIAKFFWN